MTPDRSDLGTPIQVPFDKIFLDPNNPRIATPDRPGYSDPKKITTEAVQNALTERLRDDENVDSLQSVIVNQGWVPVDSIVVWELPNAQGHYVVVEGNRRTTALRDIRALLDKECRKLERIKRGRGHSATDIATKERLVNQIRQIIADTEPLLVSPLLAKDEDELQDKLPRLHGVRHITPAKQWSPYATNLYILSLYQRAFEARYGADDNLTLDSAVIQQVATIVSLGDTKTRRSVQAASAFSHFKIEYEDQLASGEEFNDEDQYFFEQILQNKYPQLQFEFGKTDLRLSPEMEEVMFKWAFEKPRKNHDDDENSNRWRKAEDFRLWNQMATYDAKHGTSFASQFNVEDPDAAPRMAQVHADFLSHKATKTPLETLTALINALHDLRADVLRSQSSHLEPMLDELIRLSKDYLKMMKAT